MKKVAIVFAQPSPYRVDLIECLQNEYPQYEFCFFYGESLGIRTWNVQIDKIKKHKQVKLKWFRVKGFGDIRTVIYASTISEPLNEYVPDVVIASEYNAIALDALKWARKHKKPFITWTDGTPHSERGINPLQKLQRKYVIRNSDAYIASSSKSKEVQILYGAPEEKIWISMLTVDIKKYIAEHQKTNVLTIAFVGALIERKGFDLLLMALSKISDISFKVLVAGCGPEKEKYIQMADSFGISDKIDYLGFIKTDEMRDVYARSDIFILPTREDCFGLVIIEAMCAGLPIFVSKYADGAFDLVDDGVNGIIFDPYDTDTLAEILRQNMTDSARIEMMGQASKQKAKMYALEKVTQPIAKVLEFVLKGAKQ